MRESGKEETIPVLWELDRGTEDQKFFRKRIRAYIVFLKRRAFRALLGVENITIAFATSKNHNRVKQIREWAAKEFAVTNEPGWLANLFPFTSLPEDMGDITPCQLFLDPVWYTPIEDTNSVSLLGEKIFRRLKKYGKNGHDLHSLKKSFATLAMFTIVLKPLFIISDKNTRLRLRVNARTVRGWIASGELVAIDRGNEYIFPVCVYTSLPSRIPAVCCGMLCLRIE